MTSSSQLEARRPAGPATRARGGPSRAGGEWRLRCPAHADDEPQPVCRTVLGRHGTLLNCKAGCDAEEIVADLGMGLDDLFLDEDALVEVDAGFEPSSTRRPSRTGSPTRPSNASGNGWRRGDFRPRRAAVAEIADPKSERGLRRAAAGPAPLSAPIGGTSHGRGLAEADIDGSATGAWVDSR